MACFTPKNNGYCLPNVNAFLDTFFFFLGGGGVGNVTFCVELCFSGSYLGKLGKSPSARTRNRTYDIAIILH